MTAGGGCVELCAALSLTVACCGLCHEDADDGYDELCEFPHAGAMYDVCCAVAAAADAAPKRPDYSIVHALMTPEPPEER